MPQSSSEPERVAAIVLAAGASSRMGANKMLLPLDGESLVRRAVRRAHLAGLSPVVVVLGRDAELVRAELNGLECVFTINPEFTGPTSGSLHLGLNHLAPEVGAAVVILGDMVHVSTEMLRTLADEARASSAPIVASRYGDVLAPPLLFRRSLFPELLAWSGEGCGKPVLRRHLSDAVVKDWPAKALADVDTAADYKALIDADVSPD